MPLKRLFPATLIAAALLAGCSSHDSDSSAPLAASADAPVAAGRCDASKVQSLVGKTVTPEIAEEARRDAGAELSRVLRPNDAVTMEYNSQRLNIDVDNQLVVRQVHCG